ncbi:MAG: class I SAM-dependent methyltransferase [Bacteroidota bacterium]
MQFLSPNNFKDYELLDCGDFMKLERFGNYITIRPEPQAIWSPKWDMKEWERKAHVKFMPQSSSSGIWKKLKDMPDQWQIKYVLNTDDKNLATIKFRLGLTSFKHVGIFPEQSRNWDYIYNSVKAFKTDKPKVLNLFAYTGGASLAAKVAGADITHLDSIKQVVSWANENMELSGLQDIRWVVEDAMKFVKRELKRGKKYNGIILDPPAYGHGPNGESWKLEDMMNDMMRSVAELLEEQHFIILNTYSLGFSSMIIENLFAEHICKRDIKSAEIGELFLPSSTGLKLPLGVFGRYRNI